jgi:hypothetical protein
MYGMRGDCVTARRYHHLPSEMSARMALRMLFAGLRVHGKTSGGPDEQCKRADI